ncbi:MAG: bi-domain-containing oxidoreductase [Acidobacteriota bacterium]|nr:bi-domain-containing oxidoreductase [Blastocatellia bacterium]MDW8411176.1 bi-domain-containing oxidoreductase [Acidobacteriota bacterium]
MKQVVQNFKTGELKVEELPPPVLRPGGVLVRTAYSLISAGTERSTVAVAQSSLLGKARQRPDLVAQVIDSLRREGFRSTYEKVMARLETVRALGYSSAGTVIEVAEGVDSFRVGERVACAGVGYASHAEINFVPVNLCARVPEGVSLADAAYTTLAAIAIQGVRQAQVQIGEAVAVIGLGLIGQLTVQVLSAAGCRVFGIDIDIAAVELAKRSGAEEAVLRSDDVRRMAEVFTFGRGFDAVIITASTSSNDPVKVAAEVARDRACIVVVGAVAMDIPREHFYMKELQLKLSRSYGPGRYDPAYEEFGLDYPIGYVRWTEKRNMEEALRLMAVGKLRVGELTTHRYRLDQAAEAYDLILGKVKASPVCGVLLEYSDSPEQCLRIETKHASRRVCDAGKIGVGFIGAGSFATASLLPHLRDSAAVVLRGVANSSGVSAKNVAERFRFAFCTTSSQQVMADSETAAVFIATRHDSHARLVCEALSAGKAVFVEKPLCLEEDELRRIVETWRQAGCPLLMVGFNRRFAPLVAEIKKALGKKAGPYCINYRVNAGFIPRDNWIQNPVQGGGRIRGEVCHFIDLMQHLTESEPVKVYAECISSGSQKATDEDTVEINLKFSDGSVGNISYIAIGDKSFPKERLELFGDGSVAVLDDFRAALFFKNGGSRSLGGGSQDKGHSAEVRAFIEAVIKGGQAPIPMRSIVATTLTTFKILESLRRGLPMPISMSEYGL